MTETEIGIVIVIGGERGTETIARETEVNFFYHTGSGMFPPVFSITLDRSRSPRRNR